MNKKIQGVVENQTLDGKRLAVKMNKMMKISEIHIKETKVVSVEQTNRIETMKMIPKTKVAMMKKTMVDLTL